MKFLLVKCSKAFRWPLRQIKRRVMRRLYQNRLSRLENIANENGKRLVRVITHLQANELSGGYEVISAIEKERDLMLLCDKPLIDETLGPGGIYDEGISIQKACKVSRDYRSATFLYLMVREFKPLNSIELGTNVGISSAYQAAALKLNGVGRIITLESSPYRLRLAKELHTKLGLYNITYRMGLFADTLEDALKESGPINYAFIDGHHQYRPTLDYFDIIWKYAADDAVFVFDDINWSTEMKQVWRKIKTDNRVAIAADFETIGVCIVTKSVSGANGYVTKPILLI